MRKSRAQLDVERVLGFLDAWALLMVVLRHPHAFFELIEAGGRGVALLTGELRRATPEECDAIDSWESEGGFAL